MYPFIRFAAITIAERRKPPLAIFDTHKMQMRCMPWDADMFIEMNNGRVFTIYDLGRFGLAVRIGLWDVLKKQNWGLVVAGSTIRYRARITPLQRFTLKTQFVGWDDKFFYLQQSMWRGDTCCNHGLLRTGVTQKGRLAPVDDVAKAMGVDGPPPPLPDWVQAWAAADGTRPWPPPM